jgi:hypothetical protein
MAMKRGIANSKWPYRALSPTLGGGKYVGEFVDDKRHGQGAYTCESPLSLSLSLSRSLSLSLSLALALSLSLPPPPPRRQRHKCSAASLCLCAHVVSVAVFFYECFSLVRALSLFLSLRSGRGYIRRRVSFWTQRGPRQIQVLKRRMLRGVSLFDRLGIRI